MRLEGAKREKWRGCGDKWGLLDGGGRWEKWWMIFNPTRRNSEEEEEEEEEAEQYHSLTRTQTQNIHLFLLLCIRCQSKPNSDKCSGSSFLAGSLQACTLTHTHTHTHTLQHYEHCSLLVCVSVLGQAYYYLTCKSLFWPSSVCQSVSLCLSLSLSLTLTLSKKSVSLSRANFLLPTLPFPPLAFTLQPNVPCPFLSFSYTMVFPFFTLLQLQPWPVCLRVCVCVRARACLEYGL